MSNTIDIARLEEIRALAQEKVDAGDWSSMVTAQELLDMSESIATLQAENHRQAQTIETLEKFRPHWAKGFTSDSSAAQSYMNATMGMWEALGVTHQTAAMDRIQQLLELELEHATSISL